MHKVQNLPKTVFKFAKYPLAVYIGYALVTLYLMMLTKQTANTLDTLVTVTPITIEWAYIETEEVPITRTTETSELHDLVVFESTTSEITVATEDAIDCTKVLSTVGATHFCYTYMGWQMITNNKSPQYAFRSEHFPNWDTTQGSPDAFDEDGFAVLDGRYVVATTDADDGGLFHVGDKFTAVLENGEEIPCIVGEVKSSKDPNWTMYGHLHSTGLSMIEFLVDKEMWYPQNHSNPGTDKCMPQWKSPITKLIKE